MAFLIFGGRAQVSQQIKRHLDTLVRRSKPIFGSTLYETPQRKLVSNPGKRGLEQMSEAFQRHRVTSAGTSHLRRILGFTRLHQYAPNLSHYASGDTSQNLLGTDIQRLITGFSTLSGIKAYSVSPFLSNSAISSATRMLSRTT